MSTRLSKTKDKIIKVAQALFAEMSIHKVTMNEIASAAEISRRTLYMHFKNKDEIYQRVVEAEVDRINEKLQKAADSFLPPDRKLKLYIIERFNVIDNLVRNNKYIRYDFIFNRMSVEHLRRRIDIKERELLTKMVRAGKEQNIFRIENPETFAYTLLVMFKSLEHPFILSSRRKRYNQIIHEYINLLFNGITYNKRDEPDEKKDSTLLI